MSRITDLLVGKIPTTSLRRRISRLSRSWGLFDQIYPFADGNGRTGRALIHIILRCRGVAPSFVPPISLVLAMWVNDYISGLTAFRHLHPADSPDRSTAANVWLQTFAGATLRACNDAQAYARSNR